MTTAQERLYKETSDIRLTFQWVADILNGEMITSNTYTKHFLELNINQYAAEVVCKVVNVYLKDRGLFITCHEEIIYPPMKLKIKGLI